MKKNGDFDAFTKFDMRGIERVLEGEEIIDAIYGMVDGSMMGVKHKGENSALVLTPTRVILYHNKMFFMGHSSMDFPLRRINSVDFNAGIIFADIKIHTGDDILIMKRGSNTQGERFVKNLKMMISKVNNQISINPSSQDSQASSIDIADQIKKLADLKTQGILTEEEFVAQKKKLLGL